MYSDPLIYNPVSYTHLNYAYHTEAMDRAMEGGIDDVGCGVLFGLNMYRYDFVGLLMHAEHLEAVHGVGPHTISVPRICPADDINPDEFTNVISDEIFTKIVAVLRIAVPVSYTHLLLHSTFTSCVHPYFNSLFFRSLSGLLCQKPAGHTCTTA